MKLNYTKYHNSESLPRDNRVKIVLKETHNFLGNAIGFFERIVQFVSGVKWKDKKRIPNHGDVLKNDYAVGALSYGVNGDRIDAHFIHDKKPTYYVVYLNFKQEVADRFWDYITDHEGIKYPKWHIILFAIKSFTGVWFGKKKYKYDQKLTCYSLIAQGINYAMEIDLFKDAQNIQPYDFWRTMQTYPHIFKIQ
ncbi:MAG TPA: hypothetical protein VJ963_11795 [Bacteroidales bacterium]|nr:hypothetical protein [Bacteroidales bacterium]